MSPENKKQEPKKIRIPLDDAKLESVLGGEGFFRGCNKSPDGHHDWGYDLRCKYCRCEM